MILIADNVDTADCMGHLTAHISEYTYCRTDHQKYKPLELLFQWLVFCALSTDVVAAIKE